MFLNNVAGPATDIVCLNAGTALYGSGIADSIGDGVKKAQAAIASGAAKAKLEQLIEVTHQLGKSLEKMSDILE